MTMFLIHQSVEKIKTFYRMAKFLISLIFNYYYDFRRFFKFSATIKPYETKNMLQGRVIANYHVIEKGLSLKYPKPAFGSKTVKNLLALLQKYQANYGLDEVSQVSLNVLFAYYEFNLKKYEIDNQELYNELISLKEKFGDCISSNNEGGVTLINKNEIQKSANINFIDFVNSRYSIRNFSPDDIDMELIKNAVSIAIKTPSVCNRQTWKVYVYSDNNIKTELLSHQNGNRGFGESANKLLIITSDLNYFTGTAERNQCFIDGGLFSMSLVYALHSLGLGTCCLNWSVCYQKDKLLRKNSGIKDSETVIMMLAVGNLPDELFVANSARKKVEDVLVLHNQREKFYEAAAD